MDDIPKLLAFFRECKANNPQFFYEFQLDDKNVVKNVFWSHASQQGDYAGTEITDQVLLGYSVWGLGKKKLHTYWITDFGGFFCRVYADYSSVVTFDTTYRTNQYSMPLAMFVGFNNKLQNVVFGQALLRDERADTFEWLFKQFRACMGGKDPIVIFTGMYAMTCAS